MTNHNNHSRILVNETKINHVKETVDRIENKLDGMSKGVVWWRQVAVILTGLGVFTAVVVAYLKYAPLVAAILF